MKARIQGIILTGATLALFAIGPTAAHAVDAAAAEALAKKSDCFRCHAVNRKKKGPAYKDVAKIYRDDRAAGVAEITIRLTVGMVAKFDDGTEEDHVLVKSKDSDEINNLIDWILTR